MTLCRIHQEKNRLGITKTQHGSSVNIQALAIQGLLGVNIPAEVGGVGGSFLEEQIVIEEGAYRCF